MNKKQRQEEILKYIQEHGEVHSSNLCRKYGTVEMTIRRDLNELEKQGKIIRTHGGAIAIEKKTFDAQLPLMKRFKINIEEKEKIAKKTIEFVSPHEKIFVASGSTIGIFGETLLHKMPLTIVTDAINIAYTLTSDPFMHVITLGGELRSNSLTATGPIAENNLRQFKLQKAFISINGIDENGQLYTSSVVESGLLELLFQIVDEIYVLADSTKLFCKDFVMIQREKPYTLITTKEMTNQEKEKLESFQIQVISV